MLIVFTVRCGSERLPKKSLVEIEGAPLTWWLLKRYAQLNVKLVLATTTNKEDDPLEAIAKELNVPVWRHSNPDDVIGRMDAARLNLYPEAEYVFRALGDCPFYAVELLKHAWLTMRRFRADAFSWMLPPENLPVYGAREFPYSKKAWVLIRNKSTTREHVDMFFARNRHLFRMVFHEPPDTIYLRPPTYRLEVDYPEDVEFVRQVAKGVGMLAPLPKVIEFLDDNPDVVNINSHKQEKTGPLVSFTHKERREWFSKMRGNPVVDWEGNIWRPPAQNATPVFCSAGNCLLGYGHQGKLYLLEGHQLGGPDRITCKCGAGKIWHSPIRRKY